MYGIFKRFIFFTLLGLSSAAMAQDETKEKNEKGFDWKGKQPELVILPRLNVS